jgi:hypothetical protein
MHAAGSLGTWAQIADCPAATRLSGFQATTIGASPRAVAAFDAAIARLKSFGKPVK